MFQISHTASEADDEVKSIIHESIGIVTALLLCSHLLVTCCCHIYCFTIHASHFLKFLACDNLFVLTVGAEGLFNHGGIHSIVQYWLSSFFLARPAVPRPAVFFLMTGQAWAYFTG